MTYEYRVVPAPTKGKRGKGLRSTADRFANALSLAINEMAAEGWEYLRTDTLPAEERQGLTGRTTVFQNMLVFRRVAEAEAEVAPQDDAEAVANDPEAPEESAAPALPGVEAPGRRAGLKMPRLANPLRAEREKDVAAE